MFLNVWSKENVCAATEFYPVEENRFSFLCKNISNPSWKSFLSDLWMKHRKKKDCIFWFLVDLLFFIENH